MPRWGIFDDNQMFTLSPAGIPSPVLLRITITIATAVLGASLLTAPRHTTHALQFGAAVSTAAVTA